MIDTFAFSSLCRPNVLHKLPKVHIEHHLCLVICFYLRNEIAGFILHKSIPYTFTVHFIRIKLSFNDTYKGRREEGQRLDYIRYHRIDPMLYLVLAIYCVSVNLRFIRFSRITHSVINLNILM